MKSELIVRVTPDCELDEDLEEANGLAFAGRLGGTGDPGALVDGDGAPSDAEGSRAASFAS